MYMYLRIVGVPLLLSTMTVAFVAYSNVERTLETIEPMHSAAPNPFEELHMSAEEREMIALRAETEPLSKYTTYESETHGYKVRFPSTWSIDTSRSDFDGDVITDVRSGIVISISETQYSFDVEGGEEVTDLMKREHWKTLSMSLEQAKEFDPTLTVLESRNRPWKRRRTLYTDAIRSLGNRELRVREYNVFRPDHEGVLNLHISVAKHAVDFYEEDIEALLESFDVCPKDKGHSESSTEA